MVLRKEIFHSIRLFHPIQPGFSKSEIILRNPHGFRGKCRTISENMQGVQEIRKEIPGIHGFSMESSKKIISPYSIISVYSNGEFKK